MAEQPLNYNQAVARIGLNVDNIPDQIQPGILTYALNAQVSNYQNSAISYQNEQGNIECLSFPEGYQVIHVKNITSIKRVLYFLTNPTTGDSEIGYSDNDECVYNTLISDKGNDQKFNFNINYPVHKSVVKQNNCSTQIFWPDGLNPRRWMDLTDLPWKEERNPANDYQPIKLVGQLDANKLLVQANYSVPVITSKAVELGGSLQMGTYQFAIQYSNSLGDGYTSYYNPTNPVTIFEPKTTPDFNLKTSKSITLEIDNLDVSGLYDFFNLAVIKTVNNITSVELVGTFSVTKENDFRYTYTGDTVTQIRLTINDIFEKFPYYDVANDIYEVDNVLGWDQLEKSDVVNYQEIWNSVKLNWETWKIPYTKFEAYNNGANTANIRGYMRDEVYAVEGCFILDNGEQTHSCSIPGRIANTQDLEVISLSNKDGDFSDTDPCENPETNPRWKVYNTGKKLGKYPNVDDNCYVGPYEYGEMAYWESQELYPNNPNIWGDLANKPIRHHKFPDSLITHIHDNNDLDNKTYEHSIYPIGIKIDIASLHEAIANSSLTPEQKARIKGFKIARGNRTTNKSVVAKGLLHNVGKYKYKEENETYYPNYPYNDLSPDPYFAKSKPNHHSGLQAAIRLEGFKEDAKSRFVFHSPDTHFYQPFGIDEGLLKLETIEYGESYGKFVELKQNAKYKFAAKELFAAAGAIGIMFAIDLSGDFPEVRGMDGAQAFLSAKELMERLLPYFNYGVMYSSVGLYNKAIPVKNEGFKQRTINFGKYLNDGINSIEDGKLLNNVNRESSVYLNTTTPLKFPQEYSALIKKDTSRFIRSQSTSGVNLEEYYNLYKAGLASPFTILFPTYGTPAASYEENLNRFAFAFPNINSVDKLTQSIALYTVQIAFLNDFDLFTTIPYTFPSGSESATSYIQQLLADASSFEEVLSWQDYEFICDTYDPSILEYPEASDTTMITVNYFVKDVSGNMVPATKSICLAQFKYYAFLAILNGSAIYNAMDETASEDNNNLSKELESNISSYYGSIKRFAPSQWGRMYSYETIETGFYSELYDKNKQPLTAVPTVFGGDIFINRFAYKSKLSVYQRNTVNLPNDADINLKESGQLGYPMFWISTEPLTEDIGVTSEDLAKVYASVGGIKTIDVVSYGLKTIGSTLSKAPAPIGIAGYALKTIGSLLGLFGSAKNAFKIGSIYLKLMKGIVEGIGNKNLNLDQYAVEKLSQKGYIYQYVYGTPFFFVESEVNVDVRQAYNELEGNFYPNVGGFIPDEWNQEANVPIIYDNTYTYNQSFSKQNKENYFSHLREDFDPLKECNTKFPNRTIYSDKSNLEETKNNWLIYRPSAYFDFPKSFGKLTSLDKLENIKVLARFENKSQIYNTMTTMQVSGPQDVYLGNGRLFSSAPPIDLSETDLGYAGSQHKFMLKTEYGDITIDAKRGQIILMQGNKIDNIATKGMESFFQKNLPFIITNYFPDVNIDNHYKDVGLHGVYDTQHKRLIITKLDYEPITNITYKNDKYYVEKTKVNLKDTTHFINRSWTISYSFITNSWTSFHSYTPNYYVPNIIYFQSAMANESLWSHNKSFTLFNNFYGTKYPYIIEYPFAFKFQDEVLQNVKDYSNVRVYETPTTYYEPQEIRYFNKALIYNEEQTSGILNLIPRPKNNLAIQFQYPKYNVDSKDILVSKSDNLYLYNTFWNINNKEDKAFLVPSTDLRLTNYSLKNEVLDYTQRNHKKATLRGKNLRIRHILDNASDFRIVSRFIINNTVNSYK